MPREGRDGSGIDRPASLSYTCPMIALPKLVLLILVTFAAWYAVRWINQPPRVTRRREAPSPGGPATIEDLTACRLCGAYVATTARACGKTGCPLPR